MTSPVASEVRAKLDGAIAALAAMQAQTAELALSSASGAKDGEKALIAHRARVRDAAAAVDELRSALALGEKRDLQAEAEQHHQSLLAALAKIEAAFRDRDDDIVSFCKSAEQTVRAYRKILDKSHLIENLTPAELGMRHGFAFRGESIIDGRAFPAPLDSLIANEIYRFSAIERPGQSGALPEAKPLSLTTLLNPEASESLAVSSPRMSKSLLDAMRSRIDQIRHRQLKSVETTEEVA
jgi:hypothetical protein